MGDIYQTFNSGNPSDRWPGTVWQQITGRFLRAANDTDTGGSDTKTLAVANIPAHTHALNGSGAAAASNGGHSHPVVLKFGYNGSGSTHLSALATQASMQTVTDHQDVRTSSAGAHTHTLSGSTAATGSGTAFDVRPAYQDVYTWLRTA